MPNQMQVKSFVANCVPQEYRKKFYKLMEEWDGDIYVSLAFYDVDLLHMKLIEAKQYEGYGRYSNASNTIK